MKRNSLPILFLAILMLMQTGCGTQEHENSETETSIQTETEVVAEIPTEEINRDNAVISLPTLNFEGISVNILHPGENVYAQDIVGDQEGDVVDAAVFDRNLAIEELLNVTLKPIVYSENTTDTSTHLAQTVMSNEDLYDLCSVHQNYTAKYLAEGYFHNFVDDDYIDWEKPWWNMEYMREMAVGNDSFYFLFGDISLMRLKSMGCVYYNKDIYDSLYGDPDGLYEIVLDERWTFDLFSQMTEEAYVDLNGDGVANTGDRFGAFSSKLKSVEHFYYDAGISSTTKNADGIPELTMYTEKAISFAEKFYNFMQNNPGRTAAATDTFEKDNAAFCSGVYLFAPTWFRHADEFRDMETDYGIVCMPKYDENDEYKTLVHDGTTVFCTPITSQKTDMIGAICEAMAFYNYKSVTPAYYEVALKSKYSRDEVSSQMLDLISDSAYTNFGYVYSASICNNSFVNFRGLVGTGSADFASWYAKYEVQAKSELETLVNVFLAIQEN